MKKSDVHGPFKENLKAVLVVFTLAYVFLIGTWLIFSDHLLTETAKHVLGFLLALSAGYQCLFWPGALSLTFKQGYAVLKLGGASVLFALTLWWWEGPRTPVLDPNVTVRAETQAFAEDLRRLIAEARRAILSAPRGSQGTSIYEETIRKATKEAQSEIAKYRSVRRLTQAENTELDKLLKELPGLLGNPNAKGESPQQDPDFPNGTNFGKYSASSSEERVSSFAGSLQTNRGATFKGPATNDTRSRSGQTNVSEMQALGVTPSPPVNMGVPTNTTEYLAGGTEPHDAGGVPSPVSDALATNWASWAKQYPFGFSIQFGHQIYGPYNSQPSLNYAFSRPQGRADSYPLPIKNMLTPLRPLPYLKYSGLNFSKPAHLSFAPSRRFQVSSTAEGWGAKRSWHVLPVATFVTGSATSELVVIGNGPDSDWQPNLQTCIEEHRSELLRYFPEGCYMVTLDGRELNMFQGADPNYSATWSETKLSARQPGWNIAFPPSVFDSIRQESLLIEQLNRFKSVTIASRSRTNEVGVIGFGTEDAPVFFMGILNAR